MKNPKKFWRNLKRHFKMKLTWKLRRQIFFEKTEKVISLLKAGIYTTLFGTLVLIFNNYVFSIENYFKDPAIATLIGAVVGSLVGGMFAYFTAFDVHNRGLKAVAVLKRRDEIYRPLYNEIRSLKFTLERNEFISKIIDDSIDKTINESKFWLSLNDDIKQLQVPLDVQKAMDNLKSKKELCVIAQKKVKQDKQFQALEIKRLDFLKPKIELDEDEKLRNLIFVQILINSLESYKNFLKFYDDFEIALDDLKYYFEELIIPNNFSDGMLGFEL